MTESIEQTRPAPASALAAVESTRAIQEVQAALVIAKRFPRDERRARDRIVNACTSPSLANQSVYQYARGGTDISGPSVHLARVIAKTWGNMEAKWTEVHRGADEKGVGYSEIEATAWDYETNARESIGFRVRHWRDKKGGTGYAVTDERDIYELCANMAARRVRACILAIVPNDVLEEAVQQCETTMAADADTSPDAQKKILEQFAKFGVKKDQIEARIQRRLDSITAAQVVALRKIWASLKDGMSKPDEWFPADSAPPVPDIKGKKTDKKQPSALEDFWTWVRAKEFNQDAVEKWLVSHGHMEAGGQLSEDEAAKVNRGELEPDMF